MNTLVEVICDTTARFENKVAFTDITCCYTYKETYEIACHIAISLIKLHVEFEPVAIYMERSAKIPGVMAGILFSSNFYTVLDVDSNEKRLQNIVSILQPKVIICEKKDEINCKKIFPNCIILCFEQAIITKYDMVVIHSVSQKVISTDPAFVIFTSGSTGMPKGSIITHKNVISYSQWFVKCFSINHFTNFGSQTPFYFSMSVSDLYATWLSGATYHLIPKEYFVFPSLLIQYLNDKKIDTIYWVPTALKIVAQFDLLAYEQVRFLKNVFFAGEVMPIKTLNYWKKYYPDMRYVNLFGPTETTDICAYYIVDKEYSENESLPIGKACEGIRLMILDEKNQLITDENVKGELYVIGDFVAKGYYHDIDKTKQSFVLNPFITNYEEIAYKTGDIVMYNDNKELLYCGRKDYQIKHHGYRIELKEIETAMNSVEGIDTCVCLYDQGKDEIILLYEGLEEKKEFIQKMAKNRLNDYMIPSKYIYIQKLPINSNGKIDRVILKNRYVTQE